MEELKTIYLLVNDDEDIGVNQTAFVDSPAIKRNFQAFAAVKDFKFEVTDKAKRIVSGYFMLADTKIFRKTEELGEFNVVFPRHVVEHIVDKHFRDGHAGNFNLMHNTGEIENDVFLIESLLIDSERGVFAPESFGSASDGSWWGSARVLNDEVWSKVVDGTFQGFSVEGDFLMSESDTLDEEFSDAEILEATKQILETTYLIEYLQNSKVMCGDVTANSLEEAHGLALKMNGQNGVTECKAIGNLIAEISYPVK